eukprot:845987-Pelagomonas_calceolata.AAC.3
MLHGGTHLRAGALYMRLLLLLVLPPGACGGACGAAPAYEGDARWGAAPDTAAWAELVLYAGLSPLAEGLAPGLSGTAAAGVWATSTGAMAPGAVLVTVCVVWVVVWTLEAGGRVSEAGMLEAGVRAGRGAVGDASEKGEPSVRTAGVEGERARVGIVCDAHSGTA